MLVVSIALCIFIDVKIKIIGRMTKHVNYFCYRKKKRDSRLFDERSNLKCQICDRRDKKSPKFEQSYPNFRSFRSQDVV